MAVQVMQVMLVFVASPSSKHQIADHDFVKSEQEFFCDKYSRVKGHSTSWRRVHAWKDSILIRLVGQFLHSLNAIQVG